MYYEPPNPSPDLVGILAMLPSEDAERLLHAFQVAHAAHAGQLRDEGTPFIDHPVAVTTILWRELGCREIDILLAAMTHDVLEDCPDWTEETLGDLIGSRATDLVLAVTKVQQKDETNAQRDRRYLDNLHDAPHDVRLLKLADRIHNLRSIILGADRDKARRYLDVSRAEFLPLALRTDATAARLVSEACDAIEAHLSGAVVP
jgi:(p)ppGpp synthase/HD superfamily hydrolase